MRRTRMVVTAAVIALSVGVPACSGSAQAQHSTGTAGSGSTATAKLSGRKVPAKPLVGVNLYVDRNYTLAQTREFGARDLNYIARTLKLKAVAISFDYNVPSPTSDTVNASRTRTPTIADLKALTSIARSYGLRVEYRALYAIGNSDSRGSSIRPKNLQAWLRSLLAAETPALKLARANHVSEFVAGTEMASIDQSPLWGSFFTKASRLYHGIVSYAQYGGKGAAGVGGFFSPEQVLLPDRYYGASAYPPVSLPATASVARLTKAWVTFLRRAPEPALHRAAIDELGIPAVAGAYHAPYQWDGLGHPQPDLAVQANWYRAACQAAAQVHVRAIYFWSAVLSSNPTNGVHSLEGFEGHPATEAAIRSCP